MSEKLNEVLEQMKKFDVNAPDPSAALYMNEVCKLGQKAANAKLGVDAVKIIANHMLDLIRATAAPHPTIPGVKMIMMSDNDMLELAYGSILTGIGLAINEEVR